MRRVLSCGVIWICALYAFWSICMTRSSTILLEPGGYELTYMMAWGWGMDQKFQLARGDEFPTIFSSGWIEVWKRPYNSGLSVYRSRADGVYYFGSLYRLFSFESSAGKLSVTCDRAGIPAYTELGARLSETRSQSLRDLLDPGAERLFNWARADQSGGAPVSPRSSKYYADLIYLGKFGLLRAEGPGRGGDVAFSPADKAPEPRLSLDASCG